MGLGLQVDALKKYLPVRDKTTPYNVCANVADIQNDQALLWDNAFVDVNRRGLK